MQIANKTRPWTGYLSHLFDRLKCMCVYLYEYIFAIIQTVECYK